MNHFNHRSTMLVCSLLGGMTCAAWANQAADRFKTMDTNGDGVVSAEEHAAGAKMMFGQMDADGDGNVTAAEMDAGHEMKMKMKDGKGMRRAMSSADKIKTMDTNGDGMLSAAEHDTGAQQKFGEMDADKDGNLSRQEMQAGRWMMKQDMKSDVKPEAQQDGT